MKIAVIGSGFFGITTALILSKKHQVDVYEKEKKILNGASFANQFRFHLGFHYPRSQKTVNEINKCRRSWK
jgi:predicted NAD/FAD-binding protein